MSKAMSGSGTEHLSVCLGGGGGKHGCGLLLQAARCT